MKNPCRQYRAAGMRAGELMTAFRSLNTRRTSNDQRSTSTFCNDLTISILRYSQRRVDFSTVFSFSATIWSRYTTTQSYRPFGSGTLDAALSGHLSTRGNRLRRYPAYSFHVQQQKTFKKHALQPLLCLYIARRAPNFSYPPIVFLFFPIENIDISLIRAT